MSILKETDQKNHLLAVLNHNQDRSLLRQAPADKSHPFDITPERSRAERSAFAEDFMMEHSNRGQQSPSIGMAGNF